MLPVHFDQHFIVDGKYLGSVTREFIPSHLHQDLPAGVAMFCPLCGEVWARCPVVGKEGTNSPFQVSTRVCRKHQWGSHFTLIAGSLSLNWDAPFNNSFPDAVIKREFELCMELFPEGE